MEDILKTVDELAENYAELLKQETRRLLRSGGIDTTSKDEPMAISKVVITAAIHGTSDVYAPFSWDKKRWKQVRNLSHF